MGFLDFIKKKKDSQVVDKEKPKVEIKEEAASSAEEGFNYLYESDDWHAFYLKMRETVSERPCLCITGKCPDKLRSNFGLKWVHIIWVTSIETKTPAICVSPERIEFELTQSVLNYMRNNTGCAVFVDDIEYLTAVTDFTRVMDFLKSIADTSAYTNSSVIVHISPGFFSSMEHSLLQSTFDRTLKLEKTDMRLGTVQTYLIARMPYPKLVNVINGFGEHGRKLIISLTYPEKLKPYFGTEHDFYFMTNTDQQVPTVRPFATDTDFIVAIKRYIEGGGKCVVIDGLECVFSSIDFKRFLTFIKDITDMSARDNFKLLCVFNEGVAKKEEQIAVRQRFDYHVTG